MLKLVPRNQPVLIKIKEQVVGFYRKYRQNPEKLEERDFK